MICTAAPTPARSERLARIRHNIIVLFHSSHNILPIHCYCTYNRFRARIAPDHGSGPQRISGHAGKPPPISSLQEAGRSWPGHRNMELELSLTRDCVATGRALAGSGGRRSERSRATGRQVEYGNCGLAAGRLDYWAIARCAA